MCKMPERKQLTGKLVLSVLARRERGGGAHERVHAEEQVYTARRVASSSSFAILSSVLTNTRSFRTSALCTVRTNPGLYARPGGRCTGWQIIILFHHVARRGASYG